MATFQLIADAAGRGRAPIIDDPVAVAARLAELHASLEPRLFHNAIMGGLGARNDVTPASAPTAAGSQQWLKTVEDARTLLAARQWHLHQHKNCPFVTSPDRTVSIVVMTGNSETGRNGPEDPTNQAEKGPVAEEFIQANRQLELFNQRSLAVARTGGGGTAVWALLYHYDKAVNVVRIELSLPTEFRHGKIMGWGERIFLGTIPNNPTEFTIRKDEASPAATVDVLPKTGAF